VLARFRNDAGLIGAADLARHAMIEPPDSAHAGFWPRRRKRRVSKTRLRRESLRTRVQ
jgi:glucokinase